MARKGIYYNRTNTCDRCREEGRETKLYPGIACREYNNSNWTGKWLCKRCYARDDYIERYKCGHRKTENLDPNSSQTKGDRFQELTCRWRSRISTIPVEDLNKKSNNYNSPIDHSRDSELGIIDTMGRLYNSRDQYWLFTKLYRYYDKEIDHIICYCTNKDGTLIERIYIFPINEIEERKGIGIYKNPSNRNGRCPTGGWYEKYRIKDEEVLRNVNDIWNEILKERINWQK